MHFKAGFKKEYLFFSRTFRMWGVIIAIVAFAIVDPILFKALSVFTQNIDFSGGDVTIQASVVSTEAPTQSEEQTATDILASMKFDSAYGVMAAMSDISSTGMLILLLVLMGTSGGEQKKRSVIIPQCSGLKPQAYLTPKFVFYPIFVLVTTIVGVLASYGVSYLCFGTTIGIGDLIVAGTFMGIYLAFIISLQLCVGICTGKSGICVAIIYVLSSLLPIVLDGYRVNKFNPFALKTMAVNSVYGVNALDAKDIAVSIAVTVILILICYFTTLFVLSAKRIENEGNEPVL